MDRANDGVPGTHDDDFDGQLPEPDLHEAVEHFARVDEFGTYDDYGKYAEFEQNPEQGEDEPLRRQLAQFAFVREEDDREVRLSFRDAPANEIARTFRQSGAILISMTGERALSTSAAAARQASSITSVEVIPEGAASARSRRRRSRRSSGAPADEEVQAPFRPNRHTGELTMRYFFSLRETVYTVNIASPTGIIESIASIYPLAAQCERELQSRLAVLFRIT